VQRAFQTLVILSAVFLLIIEAFYWFYTPSDVVLADFWMADGYGAVFTVSMPLYLFLVVVRFLILVGLFRFTQSPERCS
jgi:hypothetical protein